MDWYSKYIFDVRGSFFFKKANIDTEESKKKHTSLKELLSSLPEDSKVHVSHNPVGPLKSVKQKSSGYKPDGLWYASGSEWLDWARKEKMSYGDYVYVVDIDRNPLLKLTTAESIRKFTRNYGNRLDIRWDVVAKYYSGIEISPHQSECKNDYINTSWYYAWDIASGCIWDSKIVNIRFIGKWDGEKIVQEE